MTHTCKVCGVTDNDAEFYNRVNTRCKECHKIKVRENRQSKIEYYRQYDTKRFQDDPKVRARHKRYQKTVAGKSSMAKSRKKWLSQRPEARAAHIILGNAVRDGRIEKPKNCSRCSKHENSRKIHAHHEDYAFPLSVVWLCAQCHSDTHKGKST